jgi:hypothetical protein
MIKMVLLTTALVGTLMTLGSADAARAQQSQADRRVIMVDAAPAIVAPAERRVALMVGNSNYQIERFSLANPKNDAEDVAAALRGLGFDVLTAIDAPKKEFERKVAEFARRAKDADAALFFFAGHAMQFQGENYLMPVDGELKDRDSIWSEMVRVDDVRRALDRVDGLKVMILDACRDNPLSDRVYRSVAAGGGAPRGLARIDKAQGMIVAYATAADDVAADGNGRNSPFTRALLNRMGEAGLEITKLFRMVGADVAEETRGRQRPELTLQSYNDYYLNQNDRIVWEKIRDSNDAAALRDFLAKFPSSPYSAVAKDRLERIKQSPPRTLLPSVVDAPPARNGADDEWDQTPAVGTAPHTEDSTPSIHTPPVTTLKLPENPQLKSQDRNPTKGAPTRSTHFGSAGPLSKTPAPPHPGPKAPLKNPEPKAPLKSTPAYTLTGLAF